MKRRHRPPATWVALIAATLSAGTTQAADSYIHCDQLNDGVGDALRLNVTIAVDGNWIEAVADSGSADIGGGRLIDLRPDSCLPGLIDAHAGHSGRHACVNVELLSWQDRVGTIEPGKLADIIAVPGKPIEDIAVQVRVSFVMLGGEVIRSN